MRTGLPCVVIVCLVALTTATRAAATDTVILKNVARPLTGTVVRDDARGVAMGSPGAPVLARASIREIIYDDGRPMEYALGLEAAGEGRHADAARLLREALGGPHHELLEQYILLHLARAEERIGRAREAREAFRKLAKKGEDTRFLFEALEGLLRLGAEAPIPGPESGLTETQRLLLRAGAEEMRGRYESALRFSRRAARTAAPGEGLSRRADLRAARCLVRLGRAAEAERILRRLLGAADDGLNAEAYVLLGDALSAGASSPEEWRLAAFMYLRAAVHYPGDPITEVPALESAARCFRQMPEGGAAKAAKLDEYLARRYPRAAAGNGPDEG